MANPDGRWHNDRRMHCEPELVHRRVAILLCTFRGEAYLWRQLETIAEQTHRSWTLYASDDGSEDRTREILETFRSKLEAGRVHVFDGPRKGFSSNFFSLMMRAEVNADFYAFADQDDEWEPDKLARAINALQAVKPGTPAMYGSRSELIDASGQHIGYSRRFTRPPSFANALVQNMVSGNTMVINHAAISLLRRSGNQDVSAHDWWTYLLVTGHGGSMIYDPHPTIRYRQHGANLYGHNVSLRAMVVRISKLFAGDFRSWNGKNLSALRGTWQLLDEESRRAVEAFEAARKGSAAGRLLKLIRSRVYRQTWDGQLGLMVAALSNRL